MKQQGKSQGKLLARATTNTPDWAQQEQACARCCPFKQHSGKQHKPAAGSLEPGVLAAMASLASHLAFWLCPGHRTSVFLFPCYYGMWKRGMTPSTGCLPPSRRPAQLGTGQRRQGEHNAYVRYRGRLPKSLEHRSWGSKSQGKQGVLPICFLPATLQCSASMGLLCQVVKSRGSGVSLRTIVPEHHIMDVSQAPKQRLSPLT